MYELIAGHVRQTDRERQVTEALRVRQLLEAAGPALEMRRTSAVATDRSRPALRVRPLAGR